MTVVVVVVNPVTLPNTFGLKILNGQKFGSVIGLDWGPQKSVPTTTPLCQRTIHSHVLWNVMRNELTYQTKCSRFHPERKNIFNEAMINVDDSQVSTCVV